MVYVWYVSWFGIRFPFSAPLNVYVYKYDLKISVSCLVKMRRNTQVAFCVSIS